MSSFLTKLNKAKDLISEGRYMQLFSRIRDKLFQEKIRYMKYLYLRKKYSAFIADNVASKLRNGVGAELLIRPI